MPRGGARVGAGRKKLSEADRELGGNAGHRARVLSPAFAAAPQAEPAPVVSAATVEPPANLTPEERKVWAELAPLAIAARTLTRRKVFAFRMLCQHVVLEQRYATSVKDAGGTNHRGMIQRVEAALDAFGLRAGVELGGAVSAPVDPLSKFMKA